MSIGRFQSIQALGAANDNLVKQAVLVSITFSTLGLPGAAGIWTNLASALFILPFLLLSTGAGRWASRTNTTGGIIRVKLLEVILACVVGLGLVTQNGYVLLTALTLLGVQSAFFGPLKFAWPAAHVTQANLPRVIGDIESLTFLAILLGSLLGGLLIQTPALLAITVVLLAVIGLWNARQLPASPTRTLETATFVETAASKRARVLISWFWFLGASYLTQLGLLAKDLMQQDAGFVSILLGAFAVGVAVGSQIIKRVQTTLMAGWLGLVVLGLWLPFAAASPWLGVGVLSLLGVFGGLYVVPPYLWFQRHLSPPQVALVIGRNNFLNALFMVASAGFGVAFFALGGETQTYFVVLAALSLWIWPQVRAFQRSSS